jgi:hypothetical protein
VTWRYLFHKLVAAVYHQCIVSLCPLVSEKTASWTNNIADFKDHFTDRRLFKYPQDVNERYEKLQFKHMADCKVGPIFTALTFSN